MNENTELNISEYYQTPLSSLSLPDNYKKLIKRIGNLNSSADKEFFVETVGDIIELDPIQLSGYKGVGSLYINTLIEFKKELSYFLNKTKEPDFTFKEDIFTSTDNSYDLYTPLHSLPLSPKYQKLIKKISAIMNNVKIVQDIIDIDIYSFSTLPYVGKLYVNLLINLQNTLAPTDINQSNSDVEKVEKELLPQNTLSTEQLETPLNTLALSTQYQKLIKKISIVAPNLVTVQDIINIDPVNFAKLPTVGILCVNNLIDFKKKLPDILEAQTQKLLPQNTLSTEQLETPLNTLALSTQYQKLIKRISVVAPNLVTVQDIINIDPVNFAKLPTVGILCVNNLIDFKKKLPDILEAQTQKTALFKDNYSIEFNEIDIILIEDVERYLLTLDERKLDIALSRWGFNKQHESLEEVGIRYKVTRELIRQLEKTINTNLPSYLTIQPKVLWANIREKMTEDLVVLLPNLAKCFATDKLFYIFIELCCQVKNGDIHKIIFTEINPKIINSLFCINPSPISKEIIINELMSNYGYSKAAVINGIKRLEKSGKIRITEQGIYPKKLGRTEAVAHVLTFHPAGLPWKDIYRIMNKKGYSLTSCDETIMNQKYLSGNEYVYLCDRGTYRNLLFLDLEQFDIPKIMQHLIDYFEQHKLQNLNLYYYFYQTKNQRDEIEYFTLRHLVREYGEEYGVYFNGKSGSDSVSLDSDLNRITQSDVIIKVLNDSKFALTKQEIAEQLRSKSTINAALYINNLMEEGKVVRVDKMVYTTTEKAFASVDTKAIMRVIEDIMSISNIIVEADVFREYVNMELNLSYSKYFYAALVKTQLKELDWYRSGNLFSKNQIPYNGLADICSRLCNLEFSNSENAEILKKAVWITDAVVANTISMWKWQMSH